MLGRRRLRLTPCTGHMFSCRICTLPHHRGSPGQLALNLDEPIELELLLPAALPHRTLPGPPLCQSSAGLWSNVTATAAAAAHLPHLPQFHWRCHPQPVHPAVRTGGVWQCRQRDAGDLMEAVICQGIDFIGRIRWDEAAQRRVAF